MMQEDLLIKQN